MMKTLETWLIFVSAKSLEFLLLMVLKLSVS
jgi:hypothetical protein